MQEKEVFSKIPFDDIPIEESAGLHQEFLSSITSKELSKEALTKLGQFIDELQKEAEEKFPGPERDLWFNFQLVQVYMDARMWAEAMVAARVALYIAEQIGRGQNVFSKLLGEIELQVR